jgi:2-haloacid dehalogenase
VSKPRRFAAGIFDLGGVLIDWNPRHLFRKLFPGDEEGMERFLAATVSPDWNREMDKGGFFHAGIAELKTQHPDQADLIQAYADRWPEMLGEVDKAVAQIVRDVRAAGLRVYAISNWSAETFSIAHAMVPELSLFDDRVISGEERVVKPDPEIFLLACRRFGIQPSDAFFVDDIPENLGAARAVGMTAIQFTNADDLRQALATLSVLA